jgi:DNA-damage-inducible protein J
MTSATLTIRVDDKLKRGASEVAGYYGLDLSSVTRAFYKQMVNTGSIPLTFAPGEPNAESLEAIREGDAFLASGKEGRFADGAALVAAAMA